MDEYANFTLFLCGWLLAAYSYSIITFISLNDCMFLNKLKTTTRSGRNIEKMEQLKKYLIAQTKDNLDAKLDFLVVWPWGISKPFSNILSNRNQKTLGRIKYLLIRQIEALLRKSWIFDLEIFEIDDFLQTFGDSDFLWNIYVADIENKVLESVNEKYWDKKNIQTINIDLSNEWFKFNFDVVICYNVLQRMDNWENGLNSMVESLNEWWLISMDAKQLNPQTDILLKKLLFQKIWDNLYRSGN